MTTIPPRASNSNLKKHYVYTLAYPDGHVFYVGKGTRNRINHHEREARKGVNTYKCNVIRKIWADGGEVLKTILAYFDMHKEALQYEIALIFFLPDLTNLTDGGDGTVGLEFTEEHRRKIGEKSRLKRGKWKPTQSQREKLSAAKKGKPHSDEHKRKIGESQVGKKNSEEAKKKLALARLGKPLSEETRKKLSIAHQGKTHTREARSKISDANKGRKMLPESVAKGHAGRVERYRIKREQTQMKKVAESERKALLPKTKKVLTPERQEAMLAKVRGIPKSPEHRAKIGAAHKGRPRTEKQIATTVARSVKTYPGFISPNGDVYRDVTNLAEFCRRHDLTPTHMVNVAKGKASHHNGWRLLAE